MEDPLDEIIWNNRALGNKYGILGSSDRSIGCCDSDEYHILENEAEGLTVLHNGKSGVKSPEYRLFTLAQYPHSIHCKNLVFIYLFHKKKRNQNRKYLRYYKAEPY